MYVLVIHNEYDPTITSASGSQLLGPYDQETAKTKLADLVIKENDPLFKLNETGTYAGYDMCELEEAKRDQDLCTEFWAEVAPLEP